MVQQYLNFLRSYLGYQTKFKTFLKPLYLTYIVTENCNLRCPFCYAWRSPRLNELRLEEIEDVFSSKILRNLISVGLTGGEPFLRDDIVDIASVIAEHIRNLQELRIVTNGFFSDKIISSVHEIMDITDLPVSVKVSIDGLESTHDKMRGKGVFSKAMSTLKGLKELKEDGHNLKISTGFTALDENIGEIWDLYEKFGHDFEFFFKPVQAIDGLSDPCRRVPVSEKTKQIFIEFTNYYLDTEFKEKKASLWQSSRKLYYKYLLDFLINQDVRPVPCSAAYSFLTMDSDGAVWPCSVSHTVLGNVRELPLDEIWYSPYANEIRRNIQRGDCACLTSCDLGPSILTCRWYRIIFDYIRSSAHL